MTTRKQRQKSQNKVLNKKNFLGGKKRKRKNFLEKKKNFLFILAEIERWSLVGESPLASAPSSLVFCLVLALQMPPELLNPIPSCQHPSNCRETLCLGDPSSPSPRMQKQIKSSYAARLPLVSLVSNFELMTQAHFGRVPYESRIQNRGYS